MLDELYANLTAIDSAQGLLKQTQDLVEKLEFETCNVYLAADLPGGLRVDDGIDNYRPVLREQLQASHQEIVSKSPFTATRKTRIAPLVWDLQQYRKHGAADLAELYSSFGYKAGIEVSTRSADGRIRLYISMTRNGDLPTKQELIHYCGELQLFSSMALAPAGKIWLPQNDVADSEGQLTQRELECLRWTMEGKTAWELGQILGVTERTAVFHLQNATQKLGCSNKHQAVIKALRMQIIS